MISVGFQLIFCDFLGHYMIFCRQEALEIRGICIWDSEHLTQETSRERLANV